MSVVEFPPGFTPRPQPRAAGPLDAWSREALIAEVELLRRHLDGAVGDAPDGDEVRRRTVRVPAAMGRAFQAAEETVANYFRHLRHEPERATISIAGERYVLLRAASLSVEFVDLVTSLYRDRGEGEARVVADNLLFDLGHALGRADAAAFHRRSGVSDPIARLSTGPVHFAYAGWASVEIHPSSRPTPDDDFFLQFDHPFSFESHAWRAKGRPSDRPVCVMGAGYASGWCEESFGFALVAAEVECCAAGGERCRFVMAPPSRIEEHLERLGYAPNDGPAREGRAEAVPVPEFFQRRRWEDELREANRRLEERVAERTTALAQANEQLRVLGKAIANAGEGVLLLHQDGAGALQIDSANGGFASVTGLPSDEVRGRRLDVLPVEEPVELRVACQRAVRTRRSVELELTARRPAGEHYTLAVHLMPVDPDEQRSRQWIGLFRDVTQRRRHLAELRRQARFDALTALPNRVMLYERLDEEVAHAVATERPLGLLVIDLDGFKNINDTFGHPVGDTLLEQVGPRLQRHLRAEDTVARLGGDEFAVLLPGIRNRRNACEQAGLMLRALEEPFQVAGQDVVLGASIGVVLCPEHGTDGATLLRRADVAMYVAKDRGRGPEVYRADLDRHSPERLALIGELRAGIARDELVVHYQPQVHTRSLAPQRVEALVRWRHPVHGLLMPAEFIPFIELGNLVEELTRAVLDSAVRDCVAWRAQGVALDLAVNVPPRLLRDPSFVDMVARVLARRGLPAAALTLEVTESGLLTDVDHAAPIFDALRQFGVRLSIDDFGTGYSSFTHLRRLPVDEIKVDRSFVQQMVRDEQDAAIVRSTIDLGRSIGRTIVAEGVEDEETLSLLRALDCDLVQGFRLARPMPLADLLTWSRR